MQAGNVRVVREMLRKKVVVDWGDLLEASRKRTDEILRLMIDSVGASVADKGGCTLLYEVDSFAAKLLIESGTDVHARDKYGNTPLHGNTSYKVASLLIEKGADTEAVNHKGETPLHSACEAVSVPGDNSVEEWEKLVVLVKAGASTGAERKDGKKPTDLLKIDPGHLLRFVRHSDV